MVSKGNNVIQTLLKNLLDSSDNELKGVYCVTVNSVIMAASGSGDILKKRSGEIRPVLNDLKDKIDDDVSIIIIMKLCALL